jgi:hypothetical protein
MIVKMFGKLNLDDSVVWTDTNIDKHAIIAHYTNKMYIDEIEIDSQLDKLIEKQADDS